MKKFFLFKRKDIDASSSTTSDSGEGLDLLAVSVDHLSFMTASQGRVNIVFNDATIYEENNLLDGESFKKTSVSVACEQGGEAALIDSIMHFISSDRVKTNVMRFDAVEGSTNVKEASIQSFSDVVSEVRELPVRRTTKDVSKKTFIGGTSGTAFGTSNVLGGIDFGEDNTPSLDYIETNITESGGNVTGWTNAGSLGSGYNITSVTGTIPLDTSTGRTNNGLNTQAADFGTSDNLALPSNATFKGAFTLYAVVGRSVSDISDNPKLGMMIQGSATSGQGLTLLFADPLDNDSFNMKFAKERGEFVKAPISEGKLIDSNIREDELSRRTAYIFVIVRDEASNISVFNNDGVRYAFAPAVTDLNNARTDGNLVVRYIGNGIGEKFQGNVARFGVISKDIGISAASNLAKDLASVYTPSN